MKPRFSLKLLLLLVALTGLACFWRSRPARLAATYSRLIDDYDFAAADALLIDDQSQRLHELRKTSRYINVRLEFEPQSVREWMTGECRGWIIVKIGTGKLGSAIAESPVLATAHGVQLPKLAFQKGFGGLSIAFETHPTKSSMFAATSND